MYTSYRHKPNNMIHTEEEKQQFKKDHAYFKELAVAAPGNKLIEDNVYYYHEKILECYEEELYTKHAKNKCMFPVDGVCQKTFKNSLKHYSSYGNCCVKCSSYHLQTVLTR